jgi:large exoprotein involved in heme utilization and adhesion
LHLYTAGNNGNGGNINIDAPFIVAFPTENSDITANAFQGRGGNIQISTQAIFGLEYRPRTTPYSDITASSDFGLDGQVIINTPGIDPSRGLTPLPDVPVNTQIVVGCQAGGAQSTVSFIDVGRTGLPARPDDPLSEETIIADWINPNFDTKNTSFQTTTMNLPKSTANDNETMFKTQLPTVISPCYAN